MINTVTVRWHDGYLEEFKATEFASVATCFGCGWKTGKTAIFR